VADLVRDDVAEQERGLTAAAAAEVLEPMVEDGDRATAGGGSADGVILTSDRLTISAE
jgi:hypothetical protein